MVTKEANKINYDVTFPEGTTVADVKEAAGLDKGNAQIMINIFDPNDEKRFAVYSYPKDGEWVCKNFGVEDLDNKVVKSIDCISFKNKENPSIRNIDWMVTI